ncbi:MAG: hypothetical protein AAF664_22620, partial [Planctomycetota bacterium]
RDASPSSPTENLPAKNSNTWQPLEAAETVSLDPVWVQRLTATSRSEKGYMILGPEYQSMMSYRGETNTEFLSQSQSLLQRIQRDDPSIQLAAITTVAPRDRVIDLQWSYDGTRLAVLTERHHIRIYAWDGHELRLLHKTRGESSAGWAKSLCWSPTENRLLAASSQFMGMFVQDREGYYRVATLPVVFTDIQSIDTLQVRDKVLILVREPQRVFLLDPDSKTVLTTLSKYEVQHVDAMGDGPGCVLVHPQGIDQWIADYRTVEIENSSQAGYQWELKRYPLDIADADEISRLKISPGNQHLQVRTKDQLTVHSLATEQEIWRCEMDPKLWRRIEVAYDRSDKPAGCYQMGLYNVLYSRWSDGTLTPVAETKCSGQQMQAAMIAFCPQAGELANETSTGSVVAAAWRGSLEIWGTDLLTRTRLPGMSAFRNAESLSGHKGFAFYGRDGSGIMVDRSGEFLIDPFDRVAPEDNRFWSIQHSFYDVMRQTLHQSSGPDSPVTSRKILGPPGIEDTVDFPLFAYIPSKAYAAATGRNEADASLKDRKWGYRKVRTLGDHGTVNFGGCTQRRFRMSFSRDTPRFAHYTNSGQYAIYDISDPEMSAIHRGEVKIEGGNPMALLSHDGQTLFIVSHTSSTVYVQANDVKSSVDRWRYRSTRLKSISRMALDREGDIWITNENGWLRLDPTNGSVQEEFDTRLAHGLRHDRVCQNDTDGWIISWPRSMQLQPAAIWNSDVQLQCLLFSCDANQWISISLDGTVLDQAVGQSHSHRFIRNLTKESSVWRNVADESRFQPSDSLTIMCLDSKNRVVFKPLLNH